MVILDTDIIIDHLRQASAKDTILIKVAKKISKEQLAISVVSIQELYEGKSTAERQKEERMIATITPLRILSYNYEIAEMAGRIARDLSQPIEFADAAIAATAIVHGASLLTLNKKDFLRIRDLELLAL
jgi:predicted nucleic acid-binding protein